MVAGDPRCTELTKPFLRIGDGSILLAVDFDEEELWVFVCQEVQVEDERPGDGGRVWRNWRRVVKFGSLGIAQEQEAVWSWWVRFEFTLEYQLRAWQLTSGRNGTGFRLFDHCHDDFVYSLRRISQVHSEEVQSLEYGLPLHEGRGTIERRRKRR